MRMGKSSRVVSDMRRLCLSSAALKLGCWVFGPQVCFLVFLLPQGSSLSSKCLCVDVIPCLTLSLLWEFHSGLAKIGHWSMPAILLFQAKWCFGFRMDPSHGKAILCQNFWCPAPMLAASAYKQPCPICTAVTAPVLFYVSVFDWNGFLIF